jgi:hypothetical protein
MSEQNLDSQISISQRKKLLNDNKETISSHTINELNIEDLKRKINSITKYQKPYISKLFSEVLVKNFDNAKIISDYIIAEQNEFNIKESTKEDKIKRLFQLYFIAEIE